MTGIELCAFKTVEKRINQQGFVSVADALDELGVLDIRTTYKDSWLFKAGWLVPKYGPKDTTVLYADNMPHMTISDVDVTKESYLDRLLEGIK